MSGSIITSQYNAPTDFRIAQLTPDEVPPEYRAAFTQIYSAIQQLISTLINNCGIAPRNSSEWLQLAGSSVTILGGNMNRFYVTATENISYGAAINLYNNAGTINVRNANATDNTKPCRGFCSNSNGIAAGQVGEVQVNTGVVSITGLTPGSNYYLSTTSGLIAPTPAVATGNIEQYAGFAISNTVLLFNAGTWIQH